MVNFKNISNLSRPLDTDYPSNVFILVISSASLLGFGIYSWLSGESALWSIVFGAKAFLSVFLAWALCREIDPDRPLAAGLAAIGQVIVIWVTNVPNLLLTFWALIIFRVLNRSTGLKAGLADIVLVSALSMWLGFELAWVIPGVSAVILLLDGLMLNPNRKNLVPGILLIGEAIYLVVNNPDIWIGFVDYPAKLGLVLGISLTFLFGISRYRTVTSGNDKTNEPLSPSRVQLTQFMAVSVALLLPLWTRVYGFHQSTTFWPVLGGSSFINLIGFFSTRFF
ncbi:MAG: hypothetical protein ABEJ25_00860 [Candidatus Bipolaricaulia bacterium]